MNLFIRILKIFSVIFLIFAIFLLIYGYSHFVVHAKSSDWAVYMTWLAAFMTFLMAVITATVILWQGQQIKRQLEMQVLIDLFREWNSVEMMEVRCKSFNEGKPLAEWDNNDFDNTEKLLEFLEKIASYYVRKVLTKELIWDTIGWYIIKYYYNFYINEYIYKDEKTNIITKIREKWNNDNTLYWDLDRLYPVLFKMEINNRGISEEDLNNELQRYNNKFRELETT